MELNFFYKVVVVLLGTIAVTRIDAKIGIEWKKYPEWKQYTHKVMYMVYGGILMMLL